MRHYQYTLLGITLNLLVALPCGVKDTFAQEALDLDDPWRSRYSVNDFGGVGLIQNRTARFTRDGEFQIGASFVNPYRRYFMTWQALPFLETTFRYIDPTNRYDSGPLSGVTFAQNQYEFFRNILLFRNGNTPLGREIDIKIQLFEESKNFPAVAIGLQDFIGTSSFSGEYIVFNKRFGQFDVSLGLGWGQLGTRGGLPNPFKILGSGFDSREASGKEGGKLQLGRFFSGDEIGIFGGIEYFFDNPDFSAKVEFSGSDPEAESFISRSPNLREDLPVNIAVNYQPSSWFNLAMGIERGNSLMIRGVVRTNYNEFGLKKLPLQDPPVIPRSVSLELSNAQRNTMSQREILTKLYADISQVGFTVNKLTTEHATGFVALQCADAAEQSCDIDIVSGLIFQALGRSIIELYVSLPSNDESYFYTFDGWQIQQTLLRGIQLLEWQNININSVSITAGLLDFSEVNGVEFSAHSSVEVFAEGVSKYVINEDLKLTSFSNELDGIHGIEKHSERYQGLISQIFAISENILSERLEAQGTVNTLSQVCDDVCELEVKSLNDSETIQDLNETVAVMNEPFFAATEYDENIMETALLEILGDHLARYGFWLYALDLKESEITVYLSSTAHWEQPKNVGRVARLITNYLPSNIETITYVELIAGFEIYRQTVYRTHIERQVTSSYSAEDVWLQSEVERPRGGLSNAHQGKVNPRTFPALSWWVTPELKQHVGDPLEGIYLADLNLQAGGAISPLPGLNFSVIGQVFLFGNLDTIRRVSNSILPHVRSDLVSYLQQGRTSISLAQADYMGSFGPDWYYRVAAGLFESMYGGVGGQVLYRPWGKDWAVSLDVNWVKQRGFDQLFSFRPYEVMTGHLTTYYDLPWFGLRAKVSVGQYLAKDRGVTFEVSRRFRNGVRVGAFSTFTNVSAEEFGEGSFDKGFYIKIPMGLFLQNYSKQSAYFGFRPLTRDGGQKLVVGPDIFEFIDRGNQTIAIEQWVEIDN